MPLSQGVDFLGVPRSTPTLTARRIGNGFHELDCSGLGLQNRAHPSNIDHLEVAVFVGSSDRADPALATIRPERFTDAPFRIDHGDSDAGLLAVYYARWVSSIGVAGHWSLPVSMLIIIDDETGSC